MASTFLLVAQSKEDKGGRFNMYTPLGTSKEKRDAMQYCGRLAEKAWKQKVDIRVNISFKKWDRTSVGIAMPAKWHLFDGVSHPIATAKQIIGKDINKDKKGCRFYDIEMDIRGTAP